MSLYYHCKVNNQILVPCLRKSSDRNMSPLKMIQMAMQVRGDAQLHHEVNVSLAHYQLHCCLHTNYAYHAEINDELSTGFAYSKRSYNE